MKAIKRRKGKESIEESYRTFFLLRPSFTRAPGSKGQKGKRVKGRRSKAGRKTIHGKIIQETIQIHRDRIQFKNNLDSSRTIRSRRQD